MEAELKLIEPGIKCDNINALYRMLQSDLVKITAKHVIILLEKRRDLMYEVGAKEMEASKQDKQTNTQSISIPTQHTK